MTESTGDQFNGLPASDVNSEEEKEVENSIEEALINDAVTDVTELDTMSNDEIESDAVSTEKWSSLLFGKIDKQNVQTIVLFSSLPYCQVSRMAPVVAERKTELCLCHSVC